MGLMQHARNVAENMKHKVDEAVQHMNSPNKEMPTLDEETKEEVIHKNNSEQAEVPEEVASITGENKCVSDTNSGIEDVTPSTAAVKRV